jgi:LysM repeat protein
MSKLLASLCALVVLVLPAPTAPAQAATVWHVVRPGETMASIARRHGLRVADIGRWNQIVRPYPVHVDETLRLTRPATPLPAWRSRIEPVTPAMVNWDPRRKCPVPPADLRRVWVSYIDFQGAYHDGSIIVHRTLASRTQEAFRTLFRWRFRIMAMAPMAVNRPT